MAQENRRNILADLLTVYAKAGKTIVFTQTKREADEVAAGIAGVIPSEVLSLWLSFAYETAFQIAVNCWKMAYYCQVQHVLLCLLLCMDAETNRSFLHNFVACIGKDFPAGLCAE